MEIRRYKAGEEEKIWQVYFRSTREVVSREYTVEQVQRWAPDNKDLTEWAQRLTEKNPFVAITDDNKIVGFVELESDGHIDMFYCSPDWIGKGVGTKLLQKLEEEANNLSLNRMYAESSSLAIAFFIKKGFKVLKEKINTVCNAPAKQFIIEKKLG